MDKKVYVTVNAKFLPSGKITPFEIIWEDGRIFKIDRILDVRPSVSTKAGGRGIRYKCRIANSETFLFLDEQKWFVERR